MRFVLKYIFAFFFFFLYNLKVKSFKEQCIQVNDLKNEKQISLVFCFCSFGKNCMKK